MKNSKFIPTSQKEMLDYMDDSAEQLDQQRLAGLKEEQNFQLIKQEVMQIEKKRLEAKHGNAHPIVQQMQSRLDFNKQMFPSLDKEIEKASIKTTPLPVTSWRVHGRIFNNEGKGVKDVTVFLADPNKRWIEVTGSSCTDALGYYSLTIDEKHFEQFDLKQPLHLSVSDKNKKILYFSTGAIFFAKGMIDLKDIYLKNEDCISPPVDDKRKPKLPISTWVVKGKVTDENEKGLEGLTVSLYDKELLFKDMLGSVLTTKNGIFEFIFKSDSFESLFDKKPDIYLKVLDNTGKVQYTSKDRIRPDAGVVEELNIKIENKKKM